MRERLSPWFGAEVMFLAAVAVLLILLEVGWQAAIGTMLVAWLLVAAVELAASRRPLREHAAAAGEGEPGEAPAAEAERTQPVAGAEPFAPEGHGAAAEGEGPAEPEPAELEPAEPQPFAAAPFDEPPSDEQPSDEQPSERAAPPVLTVVWTRPEETEPEQGADGEREHGAEPEARP